MIVILKPRRKEIETFPEEIRGELRLKDRSGAYRVVYALVQRDAVYVLHAFKKTTRGTSARNLELARKRLKEV